MDERPVFTREYLPAAGWGRYRKKVLTEACFIEGPFIVETKEGRLEVTHCWLAVDTQGYPYPIDPSEFDASYEEAQ